MGSGFSLKSEGFFMDSDLQKSHLVLELMKEFSDSHFSLKMGGGSYNFSYMQTLNKQLMSGFEMYYIVNNIENKQNLASSKGCTLLLWVQLQL